MDTKKKRGKKKPPAWFIVVILVTLLPVLLWPWLMSRTAADPESVNGFLIMFFPAYVILSVYLAYRSFNERNGVAYVLIGLVWVSYVAVLFV